MADRKPLKAATDNGIAARQFETTDTVGVTHGGTGLATVSVGGLLYGSALDVMSVLAIGSAGQVLTVSGGLPTWATPAVTDDWIAWAGL